MRAYLEFEKTIAELDGRLARLAAEDPAATAAGNSERARLEARLERALRQAYRRLAPWQIVQVARHPDRPLAMAYIDRLVEDFVPVARRTAASEPTGIIGGLGRMRGFSTIVIGQLKDADAGEGLTTAAGYQRAERLLKLADRLALPVVSFVDTTAATRSCGGERGSAMAACLNASLGLRVPSIAVIIGEAGGHDAHPLWVANRVFQLEYAIAYGVTPEAAAEALWQDPAQERTAADVMKLTAEDQEVAGLIDGVIGEPSGGAHRDPDAAAAAVGDAVAAGIAELIEVTGGDLRRQRREKLLAIGMAQGAASR